MVENEITMYKGFKMIVIAFFCSVFFTNSLRSQTITIQPVEPNGLFTIEELWNFTISFSSPVQMPWYVAQIEVSNNSGLVCYSRSSAFAVTSNFIAVNGATLAILQPIINVFQNAQIQNQVSGNGGIFPAGEYIIVIKVFGTEHEISDGLNENELGNASYTIHPEFFIPPELVYVPNHDTLEEDDLIGLTFHWTAPYPVSQSSNLTYRITFKEKIAGQNEYQAMNANPVLHTMDGLVTNAYIYPTSATDFEVDRFYVWKIEALFDGQTLETETWDFTIVQEKGVPVIKRTIYTELHRQPEGGYYLAKNKKVCFRYYEEYQVPLSKNLAYVIFNSSRDTVAGVTPNNNVLVSNSPILHVANGTNYYIMDLNSMNLTENNFYWLEVYNDKRETWYLRFYLKSIN